MCIVHPSPGRCPRPKTTSAQVEVSMLNTTDGHLMRRPARVQIRTLAPSALLPVVAFFALALLLVFSMSIGKGLDVDEHGFVASGVLLARHGLLPYRDYHYNHMPTEVLIYA